MLDILTDISIALGCSIKFTNLLDIESLNKIFPYVQSKSIAKHTSNIVSSIGMRLGLAQQVSANFSNILGNCATVFDAIIPEIFCRKFVPNGHRVSHQETQSGANYSSGKMVKRYASVDNLLISSKSNQIGNTVTYKKESAIFYDCSLGKSSCSRSVNVQYFVCRGEKREKGLIFGSNFLKQS